MTSNFYEIGESVSVDTFTGRRVGTVHSQVERNLLRVNFETGEWDIQARQSPAVRALAARCAVMSIEEMRGDPRVTIGTDHTSTPKRDRELSGGYLLDGRYPVGIHRWTSGATK